MTAYVIYLLSGKNILCLTLKVGTVKRYIAAVAKLFTDQDVLNPTINKHGAESEYLTGVFKEAQRWESIPNRAEAMSLDMVQSLLDKSKSSHPDSSSAAIADWIILGSYAGFRMSEFGQSRSSLVLPVNPTAAITTNIDGSAKAFIFDDFSFYTSRRIRIDVGSISDTSILDSADIRYRFQKNNDNGQIVTFSRNKDCPQLCPVMAMYRICLRAQRLHLDPQLPLSVYTYVKNKKPCLVYITSRLVDREIKWAAKHAHSITSSKDLSKFIPHSIRVGACALLFAAGKKADYIKQRLCWRSDAY